MIFIENPPHDKKLRKKRKREEEKEQVQERKFFRLDVESAPQLTTKSDALTAEAEEGGADMENSNSTIVSERNEEDDDDDDDEMPSTRFRRGGDLPSDLDIGSDCGSDGSNDPLDEENDGEWNMMGAALEREFLGLE